ncbi:MAG: flippase-like domain-containing protein [Bacteroidetes bacterium]|nr:flippase-like domain-containing protein [Bacteroidota bacterium]
MHFLQADSIPGYFNNAIPHQQGTGIHTQNYFRGLLQEGCIFTRLMRLNKNIKIFFNYFLGPLLFAWLSYSIYRQIKEQPNLEISWQRIRQSFNSTLAWNLVAVVLLMIVNWSIETWKWMISVQRVQPVKFFTAFKAVLSGVSFSVSTPNRVGEYVGRVLYMEEGNRLKAISLTIMCSISQLIITLLMGCIGLFFLMERIKTSEIVSLLWVKVMFYGVLLVLLILTLFYFRVSWLIKWIDRLPGSRRYTYLVEALEYFNATLLWRLLSLSAVRFLVFGIQYYLLFRLFGVDVNWWQSFWTVSTIFLVLAIIPTIALAELGVRGEISLKLMGLFSANGLGIGLATATAWFINLVIPAIAGSLLILSIKIFKNRNERN